MLSIAPQFELPSTKYKTFLDMSMSRTYSDKCKGGYQRVDLETGQFSRQETADFSELVTLEFLLRFGSFF